MSKPCAKHPANHIIVQELALLASLMYFSSASPLAGPAKNNLFAAAERLSASDISFAELSTFNTVPARLQLEPFPRSVAMNRHRSTVHWFKVLQQRHQMRTFTPPVNPGRAVALYAPFRIPPHVPKVAHDPIRYEECGAHLEILRRSLEDYGMQVSLSGMTRRGCPVGKVAEYMVPLPSGRQRRWRRTVRSGKKRTPSARPTSS
ncbi:hypothetical protein AGDE_14438 [Angomonas deanei]|uniref:Uncharacterized protein n=1 Tax=Angomonas deanei TaxID=59799 RepID=A0A7G2CMX0_9TRYP|nr:hypothetical protein AGDE_14438 [Angomonas deanei]CAD2221190.1 hypothetical protein, conserved [Angomonas deanei]|eukprot:EPY20863.1 hypothetical protein AGDE_14438 [Angomonas deanei]